MAATPRILITRKLPDAAEAAISRRFDATFNTPDTPWPTAELITAAKDHDGLLVTSWDNCRAEMIQALPGSIRMIATCSVGYDHIDVPAAKSRGIAISNTPDVLTDATADIAMLLMLGAARGAYWGERIVREDRWRNFSLVWPLGFDVSGKRLGIYGMGRIGQAVARRARGFGMELHYHNRTELPASKTEGARFHARFEDMLPNCDFLSINCASTVETRGTVNAAAINRLPDGAIVVNSARGDIVDDEALIAALSSGKLGAAGLDVFKGEPNLDPRYRALENVFLLPHLGSATEGTRTAMAMKAYANLDDFFSGRRPRDLLTA